FAPKLVCLKNETVPMMQCDARVIRGKNSACEAAQMEEADIIVNGISGFDGMLPLITALRAGKKVALANKESIVCGHILTDEALKTDGAEIIPVDSEQSALFQCLASGRKKEVARLILTASGGPFRTYSKEQLKRVTVKDALAHPTWNMGKKITIDSASLFNKGLEIMEASYLFGIEGERISVLIHPESIVHSMVEFCDGSNIAQLSRPDMRLAIHYAMTYPERTQSEFGRLRLEEAAKLSFYAPDNEKFPALLLAYEALKEGKALPIAYNAANEAAVEKFMQGEILFTDIPFIVEKTMEKTESVCIQCVEDILETDRKARERAYDIMKGLIC
ncbi:MAG: 1-deoxy-D-xylulose-5-phosphate reductoisomerase, partial [Clostridia bacterium]|nr:1-deoxy-D-xylulose-5-phosphate reductoisomerase [Clostridia bacterium]